MTDTEHLVERHIREYEARLKHIDELMAQADEAMAATRQTEQLGMELSEIRQDRDKLERELEIMEQKSNIQWTQKGGPMVMWDVMAERLEHLLERMGHWKTSH